MLIIVYIHKVNSKIFLWKPLLLNLKTSSVSLKKGTTVHAAGWNSRVSLTSPLVKTVINVLINPYGNTAGDPSADSQWMQKWKKTSQDKKEEPDTLSLRAFGDTGRHLCRCAVHMNGISAAKCIRHVLTLHAAPLCCSYVKDKLQGKSGPNCVDIFFGVHPEKGYIITWNNLEVKVKW